MELFRGMAKTDYQDVLRAIGLYLDQRGYRNFRLIEQEEGILIQAMPPVQHGTPAHYESFMLTTSDLLSLLQQAYSYRGKTGQLAR